MRVLFVIPKLSGGGAERVIVNLSNALCVDNDVRIITLINKKSFYNINKKVELKSNDILINRKNKIFTL